MQPEKTIIMIIILPLLFSGIITAQEVQFREEKEDGKIKPDSVEFKNFLHTYN